jgi:signal transduction histidine kinase
MMLLAVHARKLYPGFLRIVVALDFLTAASIIADLNGYVSDAIWILQVTSLFAFAFVDSGIRLFCEAPRRGHWPSIYVLTAILIQSYLFLTRPLYLRILLNSLLLIPIFLDAARPLLGNPPKGRRFGYRFTATVLLFACVASGFRALAALSLSGHRSPYFSVHPANTVFFTLLMLVLIALAFGFIVLIHERLMAELRAAHRSLKAESEERTRVESQLARSERLAAVGRLAGGVAHFFNNQMQVIQFACSLARQSLNLSGVPLPATIEEIENASKRSADMTKRLQQYAQTKALRSSEVDIRLLLDDIIPDLRNASGGRIEITTSNSVNVPAVYMDRNILKETIFELVRNAREAMPEGGKLRISLREEELDEPRARSFGLPPVKFVMLSISDTGLGMDAETLCHVFDPFFSTKGIAKAEGLGLASAFGFVRQSGGTITVRSAPKQGSTFDLYLPIAQIIQSQRLLESHAGTQVST